MFRAQHAKKVAEEREAAAKLEQESAVEQAQLDALPPAGRVTVDAFKKRRLETGGRFRLEPAVEGKEDMRLLFGQHKNKLISQLAKTKDGRDYLAWMLREGFPQEAKDIIDSWL